MPSQHSPSWNFLSRSPRVVNQSRDGDASFRAREHKEQKRPRRGRPISKPPIFYPVNPLTPLRGTGSLTAANLVPDRRTVQGGSLSLYSPSLRRKGFGPTVKIPCNARLVEVLKVREVSFWEMTPTSVAGEPDYPNTG
jgi:hypothetical protein